MLSACFNLTPELLQITKKLTHNNIEKDIGHSTKEKIQINSQ